MNKLDKNERGFSLIEVLLALGMFSIGIIAIGSLNLSSSQSLRTTEERTSAVFIADQAIADFQMEDFDTLTKGLLGVGDVKTTTKQEGKYTVLSTITNGAAFADGVEENAVTIDVTVSWPRLMGMSRGEYNIEYIIPSVRN